MGKCNLASVYSDANGPVETLYPAWNNKRLTLCVCVYVAKRKSVLFSKRVHIVLIMVESGCDQE